MDLSTIGISAVIPNYNSSRHLAHLLETFQKYGTAVDHLELLIVDHSSPEETKATQFLCEKYGARYLRCDGNLAEKRNFGIEHASYEVVFFTDSDCLLTPTTLSEHMQLHYTDNGIGAMCGVVEFVGETNWMWSVVERTGFLGAFSFAKKMPYAPWAGTGNLSVKRQVLQEINGFDGAFLRSVGHALGGEDVDLGLRINKAGYKIACNPNATIYHSKETWSTFRRMLRRGFSYGRSHYHMLVKHADQVGFEYPRLAAIFFLVALFTVIRAIITPHWFRLIEFPVFFLSVLAAQAVMVLLLSKRNLKTIFTEISAHVLDLVFEWGIIYESIRKRDTRGFWAKMIYAEKQLVNERERKIIQCWSLIIGFLILLLVS